MKISHNITYAEAIHSNTAKRKGIDNTPNPAQVENMKLTAEKVFQPLREWVGGPIKVNSFFRSPELNEAIGGSKTSQHCKGQAVDVEVPTISNLDLANWCSVHLNFDQIILEFYKEEEPSSGWVHISFNLESNRRKYLAFDGKQYKEMK